MKTLFNFLLLTIASLAFSQSVVGAWEARYVNAEGTEVRNMVIFSANGYQVATEYDLQGNFLSTNGGTWSLEEDFMTETVEFDSKNPERLGSSVRFRVGLSETSLSIIDGPRWARIDSGSPGALAGAWLMSGRKQNDIITERDTSGPRKTMKILSGTRFQWIAYNTETKEFLGTGGGWYETIDGKYTENIEFFSRDVTRVGASLEFNYELKDGKWHHSGLSSKGEPIYEIWSKR
jgi:hypothetical protein